VDIQQRMIAAGLEVLYAPGAWVEHLIGPKRLTRRALLQRRFRTGVDYGRRAMRTRRVALRELAAATAKGTALASTGHASRGMDAFAYAAQCLGELRGRPAVSVRSTAAVQ
jgi:hypothetical protein